MRQALLEQVCFSLLPVAQWKWKQLLGLSGRCSAGRSVRLLALCRFHALYFALVFFTIVAADIDSFAIHVVLHGLPCLEFPRPERTAIVKLVGCLHAFQVVDIFVCGNRSPGRSSSYGAMLRVPTRNRPLLIGKRAVLTGKGRLRVGTRSM